MSLIPAPAPAPATSSASVGPPPRLPTNTSIPLRRPAPPRTALAPDSSASTPTPESLAPSVPASASTSRVGLGFSPRPRSPSREKRGAETHFQLSLPRLSFLHHLFSLPPPCFAFSLTLFFSSRIDWKTAIITCNQAQRAKSPCLRIGLGALASNLCVGLGHPASASHHQHWPRPPRVGLLPPASASASRVGPCCPRRPQPSVAGVGLGLPTSASFFHSRGGRSAGRGIEETSSRLSLPRLPPLVTFSLSSSFLLFPSEFLQFQFPPAVSFLSL